MKNIYFLLATLAIAVVFTAGCTSQTPNKTSTTLPAAYTGSIEPCKPPTSVTPSSELINFKSLDSGFNFNYPAVWDKGDWQILIVFGDPSFSSDSEGHPEVSVSSHLSLGTSSETPTLEKYTGYMLDLIQNRAREIVKDSKICSTTLGGEKAHRLVYDLYNDADRPNFAITQTNVYTVKNGKIYGITYSVYKESFSKYLPDFEAISASFQMK
ncbi:MAG: hypothetical protein HY362_01065 [Candidatus Aenigmarchaeota archaeon]|nr:hypothetical protein [Candidatus Aenigmarchaeota archaeon]